MSAKDDARDLHADALAWDPRRQGSPLHEAHAAADRAWTGLLDTAARTGQDSPINQDPRDVAAHVGGLAAMANVEVRPSTETWARIIAYGLAGWCAASRSEMLRVDTGDAA